MVEAVGRKLATGEGKGKVMAMIPTVVVVRQEEGMARNVMEDMARNVVKGMARNVVEDMARNVMEDMAINVVKDTARNVMEEEESMTAHRILQNTAVAVAALTITTLAAAAEKALEGAETTAAEAATTSISPAAEANEFSGAMHHAQQHTSSSDPSESSLFSSALGMLSGNKQSYADEDLDEQSAVRAHQQMYGGGSGGGGSQQHNSQTLGAGAAMQALKLFSGGGQQQQQQHGEQGKNAFIGAAMGQASQLFDQQQRQGNVDPSTNKQSVINDAAKMAFKMYMKSQTSGGGGGGGGPSGLLGMAGKFLQ
ncbi:MAG: hypothetical protein Q9182_004796 [Xanthomendoza sp. 2 TL-2023]